MQRSSELPRPSGWENANSALVIVDGLLIVAATIAQRLDLGLLATSGLAVGILNGINMTNSRWKKWVRARTGGGMEN